MARASAHPRRGLIALLACWQAGCAFDSGGGAASGSPDAAAALAPADDAAAGAPDAAQLAGPCPRDEDLLACLSFDGSTEDGSGYPITVEVAGTPTFAAGIAGQALDAAEGIDITLVETPVLDPPSPLLIELWARPDSLPAAETRAGLVDNEGQWGFFVHPGGRVSCTMAGTAAADAVLAVGTWSHLACAYDGVAIRLFKDGALVGEASAGGALSAGGTDGTAIARNSPSGQYFDGLVDEVRIWRRGSP
ncbi:MAG TPA: LamG domain-containing protein [Kofleriaceae bacterium]|nr:LamG domain-containing protein [Kofleriaceae bacterium]